MNGPADDFDHIADGALGGAPMVRPMSHDGAASEPAADVHRGGGWTYLDGRTARELEAIFAGVPAADVARLYRARVEAGQSVPPLVRDWLRLLALEEALSLASAWHLQTLPRVNGGAAVEAVLGDPPGDVQFYWPTYNLAEIVLELARRVEAAKSAVPLACSQDRCGEPAVFRYRWPGVPDASGVCLRHAGTVRNVASALGMPGLELVPVVP